MLHHLPHSRACLHTFLPRVDQRPTALHIQVLREHKTQQLVPRDKGQIRVGAALVADEPLPSVRELLRQGCFKNGEDAFDFGAVALDPRGDVGLGVEAGEPCFFTEGGGP